MKSLLCLLLLMQLNLCALAQSSVDFKKMADLVVQVVDDQAKPIIGVLPLRVLPDQDVKIRNVKLLPGTRILGSLADNVPRPVKNSPAAQWLAPKRRRCLKLAESTVPHRRFNATGTALSIASIRRDTTNASRRANEAETRSREAISICRQGRRWQSHFNRLSHWPIGVIGSSASAVGLEIRRRRRLSSIQA